MSQASPTSTSDAIFGNAQREAGARIAAEQLRRELAISTEAFGFAAAAQAYVEMHELQKMLIADAKWAMGLIRLDVYRRIDACKQLAENMRQEREKERERGESRIILAR